jgi:SAM-dependent methyltransferase
VTAAGHSAALRAFVAESPWERAAILAAVERFAGALPAGTRVLDAGAGRGPYRELLAHCEYVSSDWTGSVHAEAADADVIAPLDELPLPDDSFAAALCTQVLEHVPDPAGVLGELRRVLASGAPFLLTAPLVVQLHEEPHDYYRYTPFALERLLAGAGFAQIEIAPLCGYYTTLAQIMRDAGTSTGVTLERRDLGRRLLAAALRTAARPLPRLDVLDRRRALPIGWACTAVAR